MDCQVNTDKSPKQKRTGSGVQCTCLNVSPHRCTRLLKHTGIARPKTNLLLQTWKCDHILKLEKTSAVKHSFTFHRYSTGTLQMTDGMRACAPLYSSHLLELSGLALKHIVLCNLIEFHLIIFLYYFYHHHHHHYHHHYHHRHHHHRLFACLFS